MIKHCCHPSCNAAVLKHDLCGRHRPKTPHHSKEYAPTEEQRMKHIRKTRIKRACAGIPSHWF